MSEAHSHSADEYVMTIWLLTHPVGEYLPARQKALPTAAARIAEQLGVSRASVGEMLKRLESTGMVSRGAKREAILTERGRIAAMKIVRRHRMIELLLTEVMGFSGAEAHERADGLDAGFDEDMIERLWQHLGRPERCPHGYPVDARHELRENPTLKQLSIMSAGDECEIVRIAEHDGDLLTFYYDAGLVPGVIIRVVDVAPDGAMTIDVDDAEMLLAAPETAGVIVRPQGVPVVPADAACWRARAVSGPELVAAE